MSYYIMELLFGKRRAEEIMALRMKGEADARKARNELLKIKKPVFKTNHQK